MDDKPGVENDSPTADSQFAEMVGVKASQKLRAERQAGQGVWWGLGMMGTIGWSVAVPTLLGALLGRWLDRDGPGGRSWTLALLVAGLMIGCINAWHWVGKENKSNRDAEGDEK
ncbi:MAG: AtpZ/AtpI family protein [Planctomycetota bacterium]|jgi:ATP synthase protein I|nr:AtpZ/AtpI family protein [Planctomycetota bacterium]